jgi:3-phenylpropionate/trans-cinnamate dioxygenase ferredoxin reductase subunit
MSLMEESEMPTTFEQAQHYKYFIIGGGMTADAAVQGIRGVDSSGSIGLISAETDPPYDRPPLSKALWKGTSPDSVWRKTSEQNVTIHLGRRIMQVDPEGREATDETGKRYSWEKLLLATGGAPRRFPFGGNNIIYYRTIEDYRRLRASTASGKQYVVIGGGFIGSEIAAALAQNGKEVTMIFPGSSISNHVFPNELSQFVCRYYQEKGIRIFPATKAIGVERQKGRLLVKTSTELEIEADGVVAGIGIEPAVGLAKQAGLKTENGIVVDENLRTSAPDTYAAGDVAEFFDTALQKRRRVEHEDNANTMGRTAGRNMAGVSEPYHHLPMFYSDLFDIGYEAVGELDSRLDTFADWKEPNREGVIYYLERDRVRGVLLWNVWGQVDAARALIANTGNFNPQNLKGRIK